MQHRPANMVRSRICRLAIVAVSIGAGGAVAVTGTASAARTRAADPLAAYHLRMLELMAGLNATPGKALAEPDQDPSWGTPTSDNYDKLGGNLGNDQYSSLSQITTSNVNQLGGAWEDQLETGTSASSQESTPVVDNGTMFVQTTQQDLYSINATTGAINWEFKSPYPAGSPNALRGATVADGLVYSTFGLHVVALDESTGAVVWSTLLPTQETGAPAAVTVYDNYLFIGTTNNGASGGEGTSYELNATTGAINWAFNNTAQGSDPNAGSWPSGAAAVGGADSWMNPAVDPANNLVLWTLGDAESRSNGSTRAGNDLYANSIVALNMTTGQLVWYFQSVHHDIWDMDNVMEPVLANLTINGQLEPAVLYGSKEGIMFVLNRVTGKPLIPVQEIPVPQDSYQKTAATQPIPDGQAYVPVCPTNSGPSEAVPNYATGCIFTPFEANPTLIAPGTGGGANWGPDSFDPNTGLLYLGASIVNVAHTTMTGGPDFWRPEGEKTGGRVVAIDPRTNQIVWAVNTTYPESEGEGITTTAGGLLFQGQTDGNLVARNVNSGQKLWSFQTGAGINTTAITYAVAGTQYVAVFAGGDNIGTQSPRGANLWVFKLGGTVSPAPAPTVSTRIAITSQPVYGATEGNTVTLGQSWLAASGAPSGTENLFSQTAMAPDSLVVPQGTTVTFTNPASNTSPHGATGFFSPKDFNTGSLSPGQSATVTFTQVGTYYYNDPTEPENTGVITVVAPGDD